ncbi:ParB N-terminal domain-containing protein [Pelosinus propionicus]|uniref:ParB-like nuclease domain-containing protein n=1 Tax=Pelosinus propionicus DSM 13327 TaxID=1123291 RepID=A0A1I4PKV3_9FIRM|nr:ParB N-terminal domain-containing protein [Pelosinus propionicus]SFM28294.1 ParB-like nuclease domain-containing protein [Pelosinus propionicus DSM 13327]
MANQKLKTLLKEVSGSMMPGYKLRPDFPEYTIHPYAERLPKMDYYEFHLLEASINDGGQAIPIVVHKGQILDGRHRYEACKKSNILPLVVEYTGKGEDEDIINFIQNATLRREMTKHQKALVAASFLDDEKKISSKYQGRRTDLQKKDLLPYEQEQVEKEEVNTNTLDRLSERYDVNRSYIQLAYNIQTNQPDLVEPIYDKVITLPEAKKLVDLEEDDRQKVIALVRQDEEVIEQRKNIGVTEDMRNERIKNFKYTVKQAIDIVLKEKKGYQAPTEPILPDHPEVVIFTSLNKKGDEIGFRDKLRKIAEILGVEEKEIWYCPTKDKNDIAKVKGVSKSIHNRFKDHARIVNGETIWPKS